MHELDILSDFLKFFSKKIKRMMKTPLKMTQEEHQNKNILLGYFLLQNRNSLMFSFIDNLLRLPQLLGNLFRIQPLEEKAKHFGTFPRQQTQHILAIPPQLAFQHIKFKRPRLQFMFFILLHVVIMPHTLVKLVLQCHKKISLQPRQTFKPRPGKLPQLQERVMHGILWFHVRVPVQLQSIIKQIIIEQRINLAKSRNIPFIESTQ